MGFKTVFIFTLLFLISFTNISLATNNCIEPDKGFRNNPSGRGWFWGEKFCEPDIDNRSDQNNVVKNEIQEMKNNKDNNTNNEYISGYKILPEKARIPWNLLDKLDPDEIANKIEPEAKKVAVMYPTDENIMAYRKLHSWIVSKASNFTSRDTQVKVENPMLVPRALQAPTSEYKIRQVQYQKNLAKEEFLNQYRERARLVVYSRKGCGFCEAQHPILENFADEYGWEIMDRDIDENFNESVKFNVEVTPDIFLLLNRNGEIFYQRIATGLTSLPDLVNAVLNGLKYLGEDIDYETVYNR